MAHHYKMQQAMRWSGQADPVSLDDIRQAGLRGLAELRGFGNGCL